jgi:quercetin dioxygenase-like cupin family protein
MHRARTREAKELTIVLVKGPEQKQREFKGVRFLVGATGERMMVTLMQFKRGDRVGIHCHDSEQSGFCVSGRFKLRIADEEHLIEAGDSYLISGHAEHSYEILEDSEAVEVFSPPREDYR